MLPECHAHICCASFSNSSKIVLAVETSWAFSPYIDELEGSGGGKGTLLCKLCYVNFPSLSAVCSIVKKTPQKTNIFFIGEKHFYTFSHDTSS